MRRLLLLAPLALVACDAHPNGAVVDDAFLTRVEANKVAVDVDVRAASSSGGEIGQHCVSAHFFQPGTDLTFTYPAAAYWGEWENAFQCFPGGLEDGDTRRVRLVTKRTDIPVGAVVRVQVLVSGRFDTKDMVAP